jgi:hypothetical protein
MDIHKKYVVYELNNVIGSSNQKTLEKVEFNGWRENSFESEEEAIQALIDDEMTYMEYVILRQVYIN